MWRGPLAYGQATAVRTVVLIPITLDPTHPAPHRSATGWPARGSAPLADPDRGVRRLVRVGGMIGFRVRRRHEAPCHSRHRPAAAWCGGSGCRAWRARCCPAFRGARSRRRARRRSSGRSPPPVSRSLASGIRSSSRFLLLAGPRTVRGRTWTPDVVSPAGQAGGSLWSYHRLYRKNCAYAILAKHLVSCKRIGSIGPC